MKRARLLSLVAHKADLTQNLSHDYIVAISSLHRQMIAVPVWLSALRFHTKALIDEDCGHPQDVSTAFPMSHEAYSEASEDLQHFSATVHGKAAVNAADSYLMPLYLISSLNKCKLMAIY